MANGTGWTTGDKVGLAANVGSAIFGGIGASKSAKSNEKTAAAQQVIAALRNRAAAMAEQQALQQRQAEQYANMNPLGAEQQYIQRQKVLQAILPTLGTQIKAGDPAVAATQGDAGAPMRALASNPSLAKTFSDDAIQRAIYDRRNATTAVDPTIQRMNLGDYGFQDNGFQAENDALRTAILGRNQASRDAIMSDVNSEVSKAQQMEQQATEQKDTPWWRKILGPVAGVATGLIPGVGPMLAPIVGGLVGGVSDGGRGAALGAGAGYGTEAIQSRSWNPYAQRQSGAGQIASDDWGSRQGNLAESAGMLPGGLFPSEVVDQGYQSMLRGGPQALQNRMSPQLIEAITGISMDQPQYGRRTNTASINMSAQPTFGGGTTQGGGASGGWGPTTSAVNTRQSGGASGSWGPQATPMPLVQMGLGGQTPQRLEETFGSQDNMGGRAQGAALIAAILGGGARMPQQMPMNSPMPTGPAMPMGRGGTVTTPLGSGTGRGTMPMGPAPWGRGGSITTPPVGSGRGATGISGTQPQEMEVARLMQQLSKMKPGPQADAILQQMQSPLRQIPGTTTGQLSPEVQALISKLRAVMGAK